MHQGLVGGVVEVWVLEVFNHGCHSLLTPSSLLFCFLFSFGSLFSTLIVVPPNDVTVLYNLCCVSASSFSVFLHTGKLNGGGWGPVSATTIGFHEDGRGNCDTCCISYENACLDHYKTD